MSDYTEALRRALEDQRDAVRGRAAVVIERLRPETSALVLNVIPDQDPTGGFSIAASAEGPNGVWLNRPLRGSSELFGVRWEEDGPEPAVPDGWGEESLHQRLVDTVVAWLIDVWPEFGFSLAIEVLARDPEGYGTLGSEVVLASPEPHS